MLRGDGTEIKTDGLMKHRKVRAESNMACFLSTSNAWNRSNNDQCANLTYKATLQADCVERCVFQISYMQSRDSKPRASRDGTGKNLALLVMIVSVSLKSASINSAVEGTYQVQVASH